MAQIPLINPKLINRTPTVTSPQGDSSHSATENSATIKSSTVKSSEAESQLQPTQKPSSSETKPEMKSGASKSTIFAAQVVRNTKTENGEYRVEIKGLQQGQTLTLTSKQPIEVGTKLLIQSELIQPQTANTAPKIQLKVLATLVADTSNTAATTNTKAMSSYLSPQTATQATGQTKAQALNTGIQTLQQLLPNKSDLPASAQLLVQNRASLQSPNLQNEVQQIRQFIQSQTPPSSATSNSVASSSIAAGTNTSIENKTVQSNSVQAQLETLKGIAKQAATPASQSTPEVSGVKLNQLQQQLQQWIKDLPKPQDLQSATQLPKIMQQTGNVLEGKLTSIAAQQLATNENKQSNPVSQPLINSKNPLSANQLFSYLQKTFNPQNSASTQKATNIQHTTNSQQIASTQQAINIQQALSETEKLLEQQVLQALSSSSTTPLSSSAQQALLQDNKHIFASLLLAWFKPKTAASDKNPNAQTSSNSALQQIPNQWPQQNLPAALKSIQSILSRIEHEQIQQTQDTQNQQWMPIFYQEKQQPRLLELEYFKEQIKEKNSQSQVRWHIRLHLELEKIGKLGIELKLINQELSTVFWSTESETLQQLQHETRPLRTRLQEKGFIVNDLLIQRGELAKKAINFQQHLVDVNT